MNGHSARNGQLNREINEGAVADAVIFTSNVDFSFGELLNLHRDREIIIQPEYQRLFRWSTAQRSRLIESILMGLPIPPIFFIENQNGVLELIDGLQRTSSAIQFLEHSLIGEEELILEGCEFLKRLNGKSFAALELADQMKIKRSPIRATIIAKSSNEFVRYELFRRLNTGGSLLSSQEIRNCVSRMVDGGETFYEFIQELANSEKFTIATRRLPETARERRADEELVLRFFALISARDLFKGHITDWLDNYMELVLFRKIEFSFEQQRLALDSCFEVIVQKFSDKAFTRFDSDGMPSGSLAPAYFEAVCWAVFSQLEIIKEIESSVLLKRLSRVFRSTEFRSASGPGGNTIPKLAQRITLVEQQLISDGPPR